LIVPADQVDKELDRRMAYMVQQLGSIQEIERIYKKSMLELKRDLRSDIEAQLQAEQQKNKIFSDVKVTPREVKDFFNQIPKDSLPFVPAEVQISHIVLKPQHSEASKNEARTYLEGIRSKILKGEQTFAQMARLYSQDLGSAQQGGSLGEFGRGEMVPEFEDMLYSMTEGAVSTVFQTQYGYHIILLESRVGDRMRASHILIRPQIKPEDEQKVVERLKELRTIVLEDSLTFEKAATLYSQDQATKDNGGTILGSNGDSHISLDQLDADLYFKIDRMKEGEISEPMELISAQSSGMGKSYHLVKLKKRLPPHVANMQDDYLKFQNFALQKKQSTALKSWFEKAKKQVYIDIKYTECSEVLQHWKE